MTALVYCWSAVLGFTFPMSLPATATAQVEEQAAQYIAQGQRAYDVGRYEEAVASYQQAYGLNSNPELLLIIAHLYDRTLQRFSVAETYYRLYLASTATPSEESRRELEAVQRHNAMARIRLTTTPRDGILVRIDDQVVGPTPLTEPIQLTPGRHRLSLEHNRNRPFIRTIELTPGDHDYSIDLSLAGAQPPTPSDDWRWIVSGVAGGAAVAWGAVGATALIAQDEDVALASDVLLGIASTAAVVAIVAWITR